MSRQRKKAAPFSDFQERSSSGKLAAFYLKLSYFPVVQPKHYWVAIKREDRVPMRTPIVITEREGKYILIHREEPK